jgi:hypothetical protein
MTTSAFSAFTAITRPVSSSTASSRPTWIWNACPRATFNTNDLVMAFGVLGYNILRWLGLQCLMGEASPVRHPAKRRACAR